MTTRWMTIGISCLVLAAMALAQTMFTPKLTGNVPFDFMVNGTVFPKGTYTVSTSMDGHTMMIKNNEKPEYSTFVSNNNIALPSHAAHPVGKMIFNRNNGQHVLHQIALEGDNHTHDIVHGGDIIELVATK
jgi:hypothetical protein